jgi:hypothetical protein
LCVFRGAGKDIFFRVYDVWQSTGIFGYTGGVYHAAYVGAAEAGDDSNPDLFFGYVFFRGVFTFAGEVASPV